MLKLIPRLQNLILIYFFLLVNANYSQINIVEAFPALSFNQAVDIQFAPDSSDRMYVVSQPGIIYVFDNRQDISEKKSFLDLRSQVLSGGEQGLLGLAFHPEYASNGFFFINYTRSNPRRTVISRFSVDSQDSDKADTASEIVILEVAQPFSNHNGGQIAFGPDGYLYVSFGDGGSGGDPLNNGQDLTTLLGTIIRIDVDNKQNSLNYSIPQDNPFYNNNAYRQEIYAYGLRNAWRFSFDTKGNLWAGDVGQNKWEEINLIEKGGNYGWSIMEGFHCYNPSSNCDQSGLRLPVWEYAHDQSGGYSITGGFVYNGDEVPELTERYVYADFVSGNIWALDTDINPVRNELIISSGLAISTFGLDKRGELYFAHYNSSGRIYKFELAPLNINEPAIPNEFKLYQNYPNPFSGNGGSFSAGNHITKIRFQVPAAYQSLNHSITQSNDAEIYMQLTVYDVLGRFVATLIDAAKSPGNYEVEFIGSKYPAGIYFYSLIADNLSLTRKMVLLK